MSWVSKTVKKAKKWVGNHAKYIPAVAIARELSGYNQMKQMEDLAKEQERMQERMQEQQLAQAQRQASIEAGSVQRTEDAGTSEALQKILQKRSALQRSIRTGGQQRLGD